MTPPTLRDLIIFVIGGLTFRYFEEIRDFLTKLKKRFEKAQKKGTPIMSALGGK